MALSIRLFGNNDIAVRLPSVLLSTAAVAITYTIGRALFTCKVGLNAAWRHATNSFLASLEAGRLSRDHVDTLFAVLIEAGMPMAILQAASPRGWRAIVAGVLTGLAVLTKYFIGLSGLVLFAAALWAIRIDGKRNAAQVIAGFVVSSLVVLPWELYIQSWYPQEATRERQYDWRYLVEVMEGHRGGMLYRFGRMARLFGAVVFIPIGFFLASLVKERSRVGVPLAVWLVVPYMLFSIVPTR